jgi:hypothetical protein
MTLTLRLDPVVLGERQAHDLLQILDGLAPQQVRRSLPARVKSRDRPCIGSGAFSGDDPK